MIDHDAVAGAGQQPQDEREAVLRTVGDHDFVRVRRYPARCVELGHRRPQLREADRLVSRARQVCRQGGHRVDIGAMHRLAGRKRRDREVDHASAERAVLRRLRRHCPRPSRQRRDAPCTVAAGEKSLLAKRGEGRAQGSAAEAERLRQLPLPREPHVESEPSVEDQEAQRVGELTISGQPTARQPPLPQQPHQGRCTDLSPSHKASVGKVDLTFKAISCDPRRMMTRRLVQLYVGLLFYGLSMALLIRADLGLDPWDVFHQGLADRLSLSFGTVVIITGAVVLLLWIPMRQRPGIGTVSNIFVIGLAADLGLWLIPDLQSLTLRVAFLLGGILIIGVASGAYIGAGLGPGPRDGLMTGIVARTGGSVRVVRTGIELSVLAIGWMLGGTVGVGTLLYALAIGPIVHVTLPFFTIRGSDEAPATRAGELAEAKTCPAE